MDSIPRDIPEIFKSYKLATDFQKEKFPENQWQEFDEKLISIKVKENRKFKLLSDKKLACKCSTKTILRTDTCK